MAALARGSFLALSMIERKLALPISRFGRLLPPERAPGDEVGTTAQSLSYDGIAEIAVSRDGFPHAHPTVWPCKHETAIGGKRIR
jgi:hypothetical protein